MKKRYYWMQHQSRAENVIYWALWGLLFVTPVLSLYLHTVNNEAFAFHWFEVFMIWRLFVIYLLLFLIHNFLLAPILVYRQRRVLYFCAVGVMVGLFFIYQCSNHPEKSHREQYGKEIPEMVNHQEPEFGTPPDFNHEPPPHEGERMFRGPKGHRPPAIIGEHDIIAVIVLVLMLGMNIGIKLYFKSRYDAKQLMALEKENLEQQLEYLKYQINPHFFMNTLNNIHALVDIDPEKAKDTILELSKMMRFILYEGDKKGVPLSREFEFIRNYVTLMRLRYTDKVDVQIDLPSEAPDYELPPLMLITFIENAFKHGISYQHDSFVHVMAVIKGSTLHFECSNSKADKPNQEKGGVGLANVKQRLNLIYGENYTLNIQDDPDRYNVKLKIPLA